MPRPAIFVHIPKTGGTSISKALGLFDSHLPASERQKTEPRWDAVKRFAFIRNPWDHAVSWFLHTRVGKPFKFRSWAVDGFSSTMFGGVHPLDQLQFIDGLGGRIFRFESIEEDFLTIRRWLRYPATVELGHENARRYPERRHYSEYYDRDAIAAVAERQKELIEFYGYTFDAGKTGTATRV
jgi:hypothetical protein